MTRLTDEDYGWRGGIMSLATWGGKINALNPHDTAIAERESTMLLGLGSFWDEPEEDEKHLGWTRTFYRDLFATTGGVPVPQRPDGRMLYQLARPRSPGPEVESVRFPLVRSVLRRELPEDSREAKSRWDPRRIFNHPLSIDPGRNRPSMARAPRTTGR